jgi:hypothetical protein
MSSNIFWYISRTAALTAYLLFFVNIVLGLGMKLKFLDRLFERWRAADLHQFTALLGLPWLVYTCFPCWAILIINTL